MPSKEKKPQPKKNKQEKQKRIKTVSKSFLQKLTLTALAGVKNLAKKAGLVISKLKKVLKSMLALLVLVIIVETVPKIHYSFVRNVVGDSVVMLTNNLPGSGQGYGGGTGFHITAESGTTVVVSNRHVCMSGKAQGFMYGAVRGKTEYFKLKILELYSEADLCVLEPIEGISPLKLGSKPEEGKSVWVIGHPNLQPRTVTKGEVQGFEWMYITVGIVGFKGFTEKDCGYQNTKLVNVSLMFNGYPFKKIQMCVEKDMTTITTVPIYKGNSGSPVVDDFGNVVAVIFATESDGMWGRAISFTDLKNLLLKY